MAIFSAKHFYTMGYKCHRLPMSWIIKKCFDIANILYFRQSIFIYCDHDFKTINIPQVPITV